jgi:NADPH:quinone reductase-like Zn-dependent oxidoreductase
MRAVIHDRYGPPEVQHLEDVARPVPTDDEILVRVLATTVNRTDCGFRAADPVFSRAFTGLLRPRRRILGSEFAGVAEAVGGSVHDFAVGDEVFGMKSGSHAEFVCIRERGSVARKPAGMTFVEAAAVPDGASIARACLAKAGPLEGKCILINGASGSIGTAAVQLAREAGAHVTAVCNTKNVDLVTSLGADEVIDYGREDFTQHDGTYDVIFDAVGKTSFRRCRRLVKRGGIFIETDLGFLWHVPFLALFSRWFGSKRVTLPIPKYSKEDVLFLKELIEAGKYRAVIDRCYPLEQVVEATRYVETGQKTGNVVLLVDEETAR